MLITNQLLEKYNTPVPRYTSYPPANHFTDSFGEADYLRLLDGSNREKPQSMALYIHIPFCKKICHYCGCNACPLGKGDQTASYLQAIKREAGMVSKHLDRGRIVTQLHYGGGTPNSIDVRYLMDLNDFLKEKFNFAGDAEIAIECNPAYLDYTYIDNLLRAGFNRFSLGIQDFDTKVLKSVNRDPSFIRTEELTSYLKKADKNIRVNLDFIYGLPGQTPASFLDTMHRAAEIRPDRLVTFSYAHVPWMKKHQIILEKAGLPAAEEKMQMFLQSRAFLQSRGYQPVGLDHYVLPGDDLFTALKEHTLHRNFQGYCTRKTTGQVYAFGVTAISQLRRGFSQNIKNVSDYIAIVNEGRLPVERGYELADWQMITGDVITELMCNGRVSFSEVARSHSVGTDMVIDSVKPDLKAFEEFAADNLLTFDGDVTEVTETGTFFMRNIAASLDRDYMQRGQTYSKTV